MQIILYFNFYKNVYNLILIPLSKKFLTSPLSPKTQDIVGIVEMYWHLPLTKKNAWVVPTQSRTIAL